MMTEMNWGLVNLSLEYYRQLNQEVTTRMYAPLSFVQFPISKEV